MKKEIFQKMLFFEICFHKSGHKIQTPWNFFKIFFSSERLCKPSFKFTNIDNVRCLKILQNLKILQMYKGAKITTNNLGLSPLATFGELLDPILSL